jgi:hypothetical protein
VIIRDRVRANQEQMGYLLAVILNYDRRHHACLPTLLGQDEHSPTHFNGDILWLQANQAPLEKPR